LHAREFQFRPKSWLRPGSTVFLKSTRALMAADFNTYIERDFCSWKKVPATGRSFDDS